MEPNIEAFIEECKFYKGGSVCPFEKDDTRFWYWRLEFDFIHSFIINQERVEEELSYFTSNFRDGIKQISVNIWLKSFFYSRYMYGGGGTDKGFVNWLFKYCQTE